MLCYCLCIWRNSHLLQFLLTGFGRETPLPLNPDRIFWASLRLFLWIPTSCLLFPLLDRILKILCLSLIPHIQAGCCVYFPWNAHVCMSSQSHLVKPSTCVCLWATCVCLLCSLALLIWGSREEPDIGCGLMYMEHWVCPWPVGSVCRQTIPSSWCARLLMDSASN